MNKREYFYVSEGIIRGFYSCVITICFLSIVGVEPPAP
jgi:hypothetical protein